MSIHKARLKKFEELPPEHMCCQERIQHFKKLCGVVTYIVDTSIHVRDVLVSCHFCDCDTRFELEYYCTNEAGTGFVPVVYLDIDEAPCPPSN